MAHHRNDKLSSMVSWWIWGIIIQRNYLINKRNKPYMMTLSLSPEDDFMALTMLENQFLLWLRAKPPFHLEMSRPRDVPLTLPIDFDLRTNRGPTYADEWSMETYEKMTKKQFFRIPQAQATNSVSTCVWYSMSYDLWKRNIHAGNNLDPLYYQYW